MEGYAGARQPPLPGTVCLGAGLELPSAWNKFQDEVGGNLRAGDPVAACWSRAKATWAGLHHPGPFQPAASPAGGEL